MKENDFLSLIIWDATLNRYIMVCIVVETPVALFLAAIIIMETDLEILGIWSAIFYQNINCTFPDCDNNQGKGFHPDAIKRHIRVVHFGQRPTSSRHSSRSDTGEGSTDHDSVALSMEFGEGRDHISSYQRAENPLGPSYLLSPE